MKRIFTLIELLVVIAIIAILSFPGEKKVGKEKPYNGMCVTSFLLMPLVGFAPPGPPEKIGKCSARPPQGHWRALSGGGTLPHTGGLRLPHPPEKNAIYPH